MPLPPSCSFPQPRTAFHGAVPFPRYPVIVHLENHCSVKQQQIMASLLKTLLGSYLYIHPRNSPKAVTDLSPEELKYKVILKVSCFLEPVRLIYLPFSIFCLSICIEMKHIYCRNEMRA